MKNSEFITRFAPSPTGPLHLGHAYSALLAHDMAVEHSGKFLLRIEDIDQSRARSEWETLIEADLHWLGLDWPDPVMRQSDRMPEYRTALSRLWELGLLYPCTCSRRDIAEALSAPQEDANHIGPDGPVYPGTCRPLKDASVPTTPLPDDTNLRLDAARAVDLLSSKLAEPSLRYSEFGLPGAPFSVDVPLCDFTDRVGDVVLARRDMGTAYHLSVVVDDAAQNITHVVRGADLAEATQIHVLLQHLLGLPVPVYCHHRLIRDASGKRLAKRDDARALRTYRDAGHTPADIRAMVGLTPSAP